MELTSLRIAIVLLCWISSGSRGSDGRRIVPGEPLSPGSADVNCIRYNSCGHFGYCDRTVAVPTCRCLDGFQRYDDGDPSSGCQRKKALQCGSAGAPNKFSPLQGMKLPANFEYVRNVSFEECTASCRNKCRCRAYAYGNLTAEPVLHCFLWLDELVNAQKVGDSGEILYLRLAGSGVGFLKKLPIIIESLLIIILLCICMLVTSRYRGKDQKKEIQKRVVMGELKCSNELGDGNLESLFISFNNIVVATNNFSDSNILGQGGFGKVYKGTLEDGKEVAVKRLDKGSRQGIEEFRNEVVLIAKLQHKCLVRLLGCSIERDEKLLIYEYLSNKSLDAFLFNAAKKSVLDWPTRFNIIKGAARGLTYLHQDSRLTIIHRDVKASNILLDADMSPKISDFGMARMFGGDQKQANTDRVVGTYGYMSPEYAMDGVFSIKSDVYSFGVVLLEIVSGIRINSPHLIKNFLNLRSYAWNLWNDGKAKDLMDSSIVESCPLDEALLCIHIGLLCVQDDPNDRPLMSFVVFALDNGSTILPSPKEPLYIAQRNYEIDGAKGNTENSMNYVTLTIPEGR